MSPASVLRRQNNGLGDGVPDDSIDWYSSDASAIKWGVVGAIFVFAVLFFVGGYFHAQRRLKKGLRPLPYHRVSRPQQANLPCVSDTLTVAPHPQSAHALRFSTEQPVLLPPARRPCDTQLRSATSCVQPRYRLCSSVFSTRTGLESPFVSRLCCHSSTRSSSFPSSRRKLKGAVGASHHSRTKFGFSHQVRENENFHDEF